MKKLFLILTLAVFALSGCTSLGGLDMSETAGPPGGPPPPPLITAAQVTSPSGDTTRVTVTPDAIYDIAVANAGAGSVEVESDVYGAGWDTDDTHAPSQNVVYDYLIQLDTDADGDVDSFDATAFAAAETDPIVGAISGIVKADGAGTIEAAVAGTDYLATDGDGSGLSGVLLSGGTDNVNDTHIDWGTGANEVSGADVPLDVTNFDGSLSASETTVQLAFDALDDSIGAADAFTVKVDAAATAGYLGVDHTDGVLRADGSVVTLTDGGNFTTIGLHAYLADIAGITAAQGDIIYFDGTDWVNLAPSTDGYFLKTQGAGANPTWSTPAGGGDITKIGTCETGDCFVDGSTTSTALVFEMTDNASETTLTAADPTADRTITLPDATGTVLLADGDGSSLTNVDAVTGDSATAFFDAGNIEHEYGGLEADVSAYDGLVKITGGSTSAVTVTAFAESILDDANEATFKQTVNLEIGTDVLAQQTIGIANDYLLEVDGTPLDGEAAVFTANGINGLSEAEFKSTFNLEAGTDFEAVDAEIVRADTADTIGADWEWQDGIAMSFGNDNDFEVSFDTDISDDDGGDNDFAAAALSGTALKIAGSSASAINVLLNNAGTGGTVLYVDQVVTNSMSAPTGATGDSYVALSNNSGGLAPSGYRMYFETDGSDVLSYSLDGSEKRVVNVEDAQTISGVKTFSSRQILQGDADVGDASNAGSLRIYDGSSHYMDIQTEALSANRTWQFPDSVGSANQALLSDGDNTFSWGNPSASPAGADTQVQFNSSGSTAADAGFTFTAATDTLTLGEDGQDGGIVLYNETGATDYNLILQPGTQSSAATITFPGSTGTLATLGNAETISGAKGFSSAPFSSVANTTALGTTSGEWADLYLGDAAVINLGNDQDVTLTHVADTGVLLNAAMQLQFRDSALHIASADDGHLDITADTSVDINGALVTSSTAEINGTITLANDETIANSTDTQILFSADSGENLALDLDTATDNEIAISSPGGATDINFGSLNMATTGTILGATNVVVTTDGALSPTAAQMYGTFFVADHATATSDTDYTLPTAAAGMVACFYDNGGGAGGIIIDAAAGDEILLDGTGIGAAEAIDSPGVAGDGANGDFICIMAIDATNWITLGRSGTWVDGGAD